jgi:hypothetical protein
LFFNQNLIHVGARSGSIEIMKLLFEKGKGFDVAISDFAGVLFELNGRHYILQH